MRSRRQCRRTGMRSIAVLLIAAMLGTGLPSVPVMAAETQSISSEDPTQKATLLSTQEPGNSEEETDSSGETDSSEGENLPGETDPSEGENPSGEKDPSGETDPSEGENPPGETDPSEEKDPSEEEDPSEETDPSKEEDLSGETDPSEEEMPEETVSENEILQSDITVSGNEADDSMYRPAYLPLIEPIELPESGVPDSLQPYISDRAGFASSYDSRNEGILSPIRNQNPWGTCWAFAAIGAMESSLLQQGLGSFDLSERHLAYFAYHTRSDVLGNASGDTITPMHSTPAYLNYGGNIMTAVSALMNWQGAAAESKYPYVNNSTGPADLPQAVSQDTAVILKDCYLLNTKANDAATIQNVKALVKQYGYVMWTYYDATSCYNSTHHAYYNNVTKNEGNHAIMVVGWDDNYPKSNFNKSPKNNGAWIVRNSWGSNWGEKGYFYISYEDTSLGSSSQAAVMIAGLREEYDNNYFNSNTVTGQWQGVADVFTKMAQVYTIRGRKTGMEQLRAVSFLAGSLNAEYSIQIYRNPKKVNGVIKDPESGKPMLSTPVSGRTTYQGLYTVDLTQPVLVAQDDVIAIVITFPNGGYIAVDDNTNYSSKYKYNNQVKAGESFAGNQYGYFDMAEYEGSLRINALTKDVESVFAITVEDVRLTDFAGNGLVRLVWDPCPRAETYEILRSDSQTGAFTQIGSVDEESYQEDIRAGNTYYYKVRAVLRDGSTRETEAVEVAADTIVFSSQIEAHVDNMKAILSWDPVTGAAGYELCKKASEQSDYSILGTVTGKDDLSYTDDLSDGDVGDYEYRIRAYNEEGAYTEWSSPKVVTFEFKVQQTAYNKLKFSWTEYEYTVPAYVLTLEQPQQVILCSYPAYWTSKEEDMTGLFKENNVILDEPEFKVGEDYTYGLKVWHTGSYWTPPVYIYPSVTFRTVPEVSFTSASYEKGKGVTLKWENGAAEQMEIYRNTMPKRPDQPYKTVNAGENSYVDTGTEEGTGYYYWLRPTLTNSSGELVEGAVTDSKYIAIPLLEKATVLESVQARSGTEAVITWESNLSSAGYYLYRSAEAQEKGERIAEITDNKAAEYTDKGLSPGTVYYYSIAARVSAGSETKEDVLSPQIGVRMLPSVPVFKQPALSGSRVALQWERTEGADGYVLERCVEGEDFAQIAEMDSAAVVQYEDADTIYDMIYAYRVKAYNTDIDGKRQYAEVSNTVKIATPITPIAIKGLRAIDEHSLQIVWEDVPGAEEYALYRSENAVSGYTKIAEHIKEKAPENDTLSYEDTTCTTGKTYYYKVQVFKNGINSELEQTRAASGYTKPAMPTVVRATHDTITIQNNPLYEYAISRTYEKASTLLYTDSTDTDSTETELTFTGLEADSTYYIYVRTKQSVTEEEPVYGAALQTTTKIKIELVLSRTDVVISKGNKVDITASLKPSNMHYTGLQWSAYGADGTHYVTQEDGNVFKVIGSDGKEILRITGNTLSATGGSKDKVVDLQAEVTEKEADLQTEVKVLPARCHVVVNVPVTELAMGDFKVNGEARDSLDDICVSDEIEVSVSLIPAYNADDVKCDWSTTNGNVLKITDSTDTTVTLQAEGVGNCVLRARTADGISIEQKITVQKKEEVYGIWLSDKELSDAELRDVEVTSDENGNFVAEGLEAKPAYKLDLSQDTADAADSIKVYAYALTADNAKTEDGKVTGGSLELMQNCSYKSANPLTAEVSEDGVITAKAKGETDIFVYDTKGNAVYGSCHIEVSGVKPQEEAVKTWPFDKAYKFSAVASAVSIHSYAIDGKSSAQLRIKDQFGNEYTPQENEKYFTFTSAKPSVCIVDEKGEVTPNPGYRPNKNETVTVTATLDNDLGKRKVTFKVTILAVKQVDSIQMLSANQTDGTRAQDAEAEYTAAPETVRVRFEDKGTMTFSAKAYDRFGEEMTETALQWSVTDTSIAAVKLSKDKKYATVTFKKAGRTNLVCQAKDTWKRSSSVQLVLLDTAVVPSEKQVTLNLCQEMTEDNKRLSGEFQLRIPAGADVDALEIKQIKKGKEILTQDAVRFSIVDKQNADYSIAVDNTDGYADSIKNNTTYELTIGTTVKGLELGDQQETFIVKVKAVSKKPSVSVASPTIDRIYTQTRDRKALLVIKAPDVVESVRVLKSGSEGQINQFDEYISIEKKGGQWYAVLDASKEYPKTSIKGKLALKVTGYEEVICNVTVKTPKKAKAVKQQTVPSIYIDTENANTGENNTADISLYNNTDKTVLTQMEVVSCTSPKLDVTVGDDGTLKATVKQDVSYKNGETLTAKLQIMETDNAGKPVWADPVKVDIKVKVYTTPPKVTIAQKTLTLNKQAPGEQAVTTLKIDLQGASFKPLEDGDIFDITNNRYLSADGWPSITFDEKSGTLQIGFKPDRAEEVAAGSYKFRMFNFLEGDVDLINTFRNEFTVKVIDVQPTATVKVSGKLDLVNRENTTLAGKITMKNAISQVKDVTILQAEDMPEDTLKAHPYFKAVYKGSNIFGITLTEEGMKAKLETKTYTLPVVITLEGGDTIETKLSFKPTQSVPKIKAPAAQTVYKYTGELTKDYNLSQSLPAGVRIAKIQAAKVPEGMGVVTRNGHVLVTLSDTGMKKGSYQVNANVYFEGEQELTGYPDGKPLSVKITVKVEN